MFNDILGDGEKIIDLSKGLEELSEENCENCEVASYILSNFHGTKVLCQRTGHHMLYKDWCEKWEQRSKVKPN